MYIFRDSLSLKTTISSDIRLRPTGAFSINVDTICAVKTMFVWESNLIHASIKYCSCICYKAILVLKNKNNKEQDNEQFKSLKSKNLEESAIHRVSNTVYLLGCSVQLSSSQVMATTTLYNSLLHP